MHAECTVNYEMLRPHEIISFVLGLFDSAIEKSLDKRSLGIAQVLRARVVRFWGSMSYYPKTSKYFL